MQNENGKVILSQCEQKNKKMRLISLENIQILNIESLKNIK